MYIQLFSVHGLIRSESPELGRDADTGGQITYVLELAKALSAHNDIKRVDLFTRLISDKTVSDDYSSPIETINEKCRIVRIQCGGKRYLRKEMLWPHLDEYVDKTIKFIKRQDLIPDVVHGHYADAGYIAMQLSEIFGVPFIFTGHSLGRNKMLKLIDDGMKIDDINRKYRINTRIFHEEIILKYADLIITSTRQEIEKQYGLYENAKKPCFKVIPPGIDIERFYPYYHNMMQDHIRYEEQIHANASVLQELNRFFLKPDKPIILALCRPDKKKNISGLIKAYGQDRELQAMANLAIFAGIRKNINEKEENEREVLTEMLLLMDQYDLYGKMAIPKKHEFAFEVPELYRIVAESKGAFVNIALVEPFGLTLLEASASGLPIIATNDGGPRDIIRNCKNGILVDPLNCSAVQKALKKIISTPDLWESYSKNGIMNTKKVYTWESHVNTYVKEIKHKMDKIKATGFADEISSKAIGKRLTSLNYLLVTDIDNTLIGGNKEELEILLDILKKNRKKLGFAVATGRTMQSAVAYLVEKHIIPKPDIIISSVGTEIYYAGNHIYDKGWHAHISHRWDRELIRQICDSLPFLEYQEEETQRHFKISYFMEPGKDRISQIHEKLSKKRVSYQLIYSQENYLDILPYRASKGKALRYLSYKWEIPLESIVACGDSGNDEEMLRGEPQGIVVGNYSIELERLKGLGSIYFADKHYAAGILEGLAHYNFMEKIQGNQ